MEKNATWNTSVSAKNPLVLIDIGLISEPRATCPSCENKLVLALANIFGLKVHSWRVYGTVMNFFPTPSKEITKCTTGWDLSRAAVISVVWGQTTVRQEVFPSSFQFRLNVREICNFRKTNDDFWTSKWTNSLNLRNGAMCFIEVSVKQLVLY